MRAEILGIAFAATGLSLGYTQVASADSDLAQQLHDLDRMRHGKDTPFEEVRQRGEELLKEHTAPEEQGQIYYHLADLYGQAAMVHPELVIDHARHALQLPITPSQRLRLYIYLGDAMVIGNSHLNKNDRKPFSEIRKIAVVPYLEGLKDARKYVIPSERPALPGVGMYTMPEGSPPYQKAKMDHDRQMAAREQAKIEQELWDNRRILTDQIVGLYTRKPYASTELRQIATATLADPIAVDSLMRTIAEKGALHDDPVNSFDAPRAAP